MKKLSKKQKILTAILVPIGVILIVLGSLIISLSVFTYKKAKSRRLRPYNCTRAAY